jgi:plasmid stabilization system protein ParE
MHLEYSEQSIIDLDNIIEYIAKDSRNRALQYIEKMKSKIELLVVVPDIGVACKAKKINKDCGNKNFAIIPKRISNAENHD